MPGISILCDSVLLKRALESFLGDRISAYGTCDLVISDKPRQIDKPVLVIGEHLPKPFSRTQLLLTLERFGRMDDIKAAGAGLLESRPENERGSLDDEIADLTRRFAAELLELLKRKPA
ncbi:MAG: hypothetical protein AB7E49_08400 [Campylobacterales bacterium]